MATSAYSDWSALCGTHASKLFLFSPLLIKFGFACILSWGFFLNLGMWDIRWLTFVRKSSRSAFSCLFFSFFLSRKHVICHAWKYKAHFTKPSTCLLLQHRLTISVIEMSIIGTGCMILRTILERILVLSMSVVHEVNKCFLGIVISPPLQLYFRIQSRTKKKGVV